MFISYTEFNVLVYRITTCGAFTKQYLVEPDSPSLGCKVNIEHAGADGGWHCETIAVFQPGSSDAGSFI